MITPTLPVTRRFPRISCRIRPRTTKIDNLKIKNVLAPVDFSERSIETLELAAGIAKQFGANLHIAHVYESDMPLTTIMAIPLARPSVDVAPGVRRHLRDVANKTGIELPAAFLHSCEGSPFEGIFRL